MDRVPLSAPSPDEHGDGVNLLVPGLRRRRWRVIGSGRHRLAEESMREVVFGVEDGTVQNMALVAGMVGAALANRVVVIAAAINAISGVLSMAMGTYLSSKAERDVALAHGDPAPQRYTPERDALVMAAAYASGALIPLLPFVVGLPRVAALWISMGVAAATLFVLGVAKAVASRQARLRSGLEMLLLASAAGVLGYALGSVARVVFGIEL
ncbi:MAG: hypothetical protein A2Z12_01105 [Actinobacteria bacterium RBG_16_68_21]|nr:MAG: hypothetical protein A2Z12_01105 [Actinobacteria bacterium RBG_16_68_21]